MIDNRINHDKYLKKLLPFLKKKLVNQTFPIRWLIDSAVHRARMNAKELSVFLFFIKFT
jgi:hypothetical protein